MTEKVEADRIEVVEVNNSRTLNLYLDDQMVGSFVGFSSFCPYVPEDDGK